MSNLTANGSNKESATKPLATEVDSGEVRENLSGGDGNGAEWKNGAD